MADESCGAQLDENGRAVPGLAPAIGPAQEPWRPSRKLGLAIALISIPALIGFAFAFSLPHEIANKALFHSGSGAERTDVLQDPYVIAPLFAAGFWLFALLLCHLGLATPARMATPGFIAIIAAVLGFANVARAVVRPVSGLDSMLVALLVPVPLAIALFGAAHIAVARGGSSTAWAAAGWISVALAIPASFLMLVGLGMPSNG